MRNSCPVCHSTNIHRLHTARRDRQHGRRGRWCRNRCWWCSVRRIQPAQPSVLSGGPAGMLLGGLAGHPRWSARWCRRSDSRRQSR